MPKQHVDLEERHDLQQELEDLQKKAQEERDRAGGLSRGLILSSRQGNYRNLKVFSCGVSLFEPLRLCPASRAGQSDLGGCGEQQPEIDAADSVGIILETPASQD